MSNAIAQIEESIANNEYPEPVLSVRVYALIMSARHLAAGSDWRLHYSAASIQDAKEMIRDHGFLGDMHMIVSEDHNEIVFPETM